MILKRRVLPFNEKKIGINLCSVFSFTVLLNCTDWKKKSLYVRIGLAFMGQIARVKIKSTMERKVKTKAKKGIFLVLKWINNTFD